MARKGAPPKYEKWLTEEGLAKIKTWCDKGLTNKKIAKNMGITAATLCEWQKNFIELSELLKNRTEDMIDETENALYKSAKGYEYKEVTKERVLNRKTGEYELVVTKEVTKHVPPSNTAQIFILKNRRAEQWRDVNRIEVSKSVDESVKEMDIYFESRKKDGS